MTSTALKSILAAALALATLAGAASASEVQAPAQDQAAPQSIDLSGDDEVLGHGKFGFRFRAHAYTPVYVPTYKVCEKKWVCWKTHYGHKICGWKTFCH